MSIQSEITRISGAKSDIADAIELKGVTVPTASKIDDMAALILQIRQGGATITETPDPAGGTVITIDSEHVVTVTPLSVTSNGTYTANEGYAYNPVSVSVSNSGPTLQSKEVTPTESSQTVTPDNGYDGLSSVSVGAISSTYVGSEITSRSSSDLSASGATVTAPAGYYASQATKTVASGSVTAPSTISGSSASVSTGTNTLTLSKSVSVTPNVTAAGYISSGTAGNAAVSLTASVTTKAAATITPGTTNQTIASGTYLTGTQTISGDADLVATNILSTANIFGVQGSVVIQHYYTGSSAPSSSTGVNGDIYLQTS